MQAIWHALATHRAAHEGQRIEALFEEPARADDYSSTACGLILDFSKTAIDAVARDLLLDLYAASGAEARREAMFAGGRINASENRAVLHSALRAEDDAALLLDGRDVMPAIRDTRARMRDFAALVRRGEALPGGAVRDVVNIGIGGSDLGPAMATRALSPWADGPRLHFVSNVDGADLCDVLAGLVPETTLFVIASKTFTTIETMTNAQSARDWLAAAGIAEPGAHFAAVSTAMQRTAAFGIAPERVFGFEDWVGGRYSVWGPVGLALMIAIGASAFDDFRAGARAMDQHFRTAPAAESLPVWLALTGIWHHQICGYPTRAVLPYAQRLARLPAYLQQLEMESNGKRVTLTGEALTRASGPVVWGEPGTNGQHAFYQLIHQGTQVVPCEFMLFAEGVEAGEVVHQRLLLANGLAQSQALMRGRAMPDNLHRDFPGNRPSVTLAARRLDPFTLGAIIALYEHRVFVEGAILGINSFDQWGVELGKELALRLAPLLEGAAVEGHDPSTLRLAAALCAMTGEG